MLADAGTNVPLDKIIETNEVDPNLDIDDKYLVYLDPSSETPIETEVIEISHLPSEGESLEEMRIYVEAKDPHAVTAVQNKDAHMTELNTGVKRAQKPKQS